MTTVFLSGSRQLSRLNASIETRISNMIEKGLRIIVGDASGADKAMQTFLSDAKYSNVIVYCAGETCRNNIGPRGWLGALRSSIYFSVHQLQAVHSDRKRLTSAGQ